MMSRRLEGSGKVKGKWRISGFQKSVKINIKREKHDNYDQ